MLKEILNTLWTKIASAVAALLILILTTQYLGAEGRGLVSLVSSSFGTVGIFAGFIGGPAVIYLASKRKLQYLLIPTYGWILLVSVTGTVVISFFSLVPAPYILPVAILSVCSSVYVANFYVLVGHQKVRVNNLIYLGQWVVNLAAMVIFFVLLHQPAPELAIAAIFISYIFGLFMTFYLMKTILEPEPYDMTLQIAELRKMVLISFYAQAAAVMYYLFFRLGIFALGTSSGLAEVGIYSVGVNLAEFILLASQSLALVGYSRISNTENREYSRDITIKLTKFGFVLTLAITTILILLPAPVYAMVFGNDFVSVPKVLLAMSPGIIAFGTSVIIFNFFAGIGRNQVNAFAAFIGFISVVACSSVFIPTYGVYGAGISASVAFILMSGILMGIFLRETRTRAREFFLGKQDFIYLIKKFRELND
jgi:O-antigen/teichoic acid export membrane protein